MWPAVDSRVTKPKPRLRPVRGFPAQFGNQVALGLAVEVDHLGTGMDAGIGAAGTGYLHRMIGDLAQGCLYMVLDAIASFFK